MNKDVPLVCLDRKEASQVGFGVTAKRLKKSHHYGRGIIFFKLHMLGRDISLVLECKLSCVLITLINCHASWLVESNIFIYRVLCTIFTVSRTIAELLTEQKE